MLRGVIWNLFLAAVPVVAGYILAWGLARHGKRRNLPLVVCVPLGLLWLALLPNTCYLLTEWRHLLFDERWKDLLDSGRADRSAMLKTAHWAFLFAGYSGAGVLLFALAIRPMERWLRAARRHPVTYAPFFFFLMSLGVYLGLIERFNSWDLLTRPGIVWSEALSALAYPVLLVNILLFAAVLWGLYEAVDIWFDGVAERLRRFGLLPTSRFARSF